MPKLNPYLENKKPIELVQELKDEYKVPSYEEFVRNYENDGNLSYDDLNGGNVGEVKGYGPCSGCGCDSSFDKCYCASCEMSIYSHRNGFKVGNVEASGRVGIKKRII